MSDNIAIASYLRNFIGSSLNLLHYSQIPYLMGAVESLLNKCHVLYCKQF